MGKHRSNGISIPQCHPDCMWGILHVLKYQRWHWRFIKKRLPHKKHDSGAENPGDDLQASNTDDLSKYRKAEVANSKVEGKKRQSSAATKNSVRSRLKALITEDMSRRKGRGWHHRSSTCPERSQLTGIGSVHQAEAHMDDLPEIALNDESHGVADENNKIVSDSSFEDQVLPKSLEEPITTSDENDEDYSHSSHDQVDEIENAIFSQEDLSDKKQAFLKQNSISSKEVSKDGSAYESKYLMDALDIININKRFLQTILQDPGSPLAHHFHKQQAISAKMGVTKSETFPSPGVSSRRGSGRLRQKQKQDSTEFHAKETESDHESMPLIAADHRAEMADISSSGSSHYLKQSNGNQVAKRRFKHLKQNIKQAIKESKKERHRIAMDAVLHKIPHRKGFSKDLSKDIVDYFKDFSRIRDVFSEISTSKRIMKHHRRASSFSESMDRYTQLYESSFNKEAKEHISKRIQERREEDMVLPRRNAKKSLGRILSSPELHSYYFHHTEDSSDAFSSDMPTTFADSTLSISSLTEQKILDVSEALDYRSQDILRKSESEENMIDIRETLSLSADQLVSNSSTNSKTIAQVGKTSDLMIWDNVSQSEQDSKPGIIPIKKLEEPSSIPLLNITFEEQISKPQEADLELKQSHGLPNELEFWDDSQHELRDKFTYVRDVLELSGFSGNENLGTLHADDQPLDPLVYEVVKGCSFCDPHCSSDEEVIGYCNHPLLFDLINEVLMELYERSYSYSPRFLSSLCHISPMPVGNRLLKEVWANISWYLSYESGFDKPLDYVANRDLTRSDGWMNLQFENECLGLELEELIFDDLLEELI